MMMPHDANDAGVPRPAELAAFADGALDDATRSRVQTWLSHHPDAAAELDAHRQLQRLFQSTAPADPGEAAWAAVRQRIDQRIAPRRRRAAIVMVARISRFLAPVAVAASVLAMVLLHQPADPQPSLPPVAEAVEAYPVASTDDVEIISMHDDDRPTLVVGKPPLSEAMVLVSPGDATEISIEPDVDGMMPAVARAVDGMATTMVVAPLPAANAGVDEKNP